MKSTEFRNAVAGLMVLLLTGSGYAFVVEMVPLVLLVLIAMAGLWFGVKYGAARLAAGLWHTPVGSPPAIAVITGGALFVFVLWLQFLMFDTDIGQAAGQALPEDMDFWDYIIMRVGGGYGFMGGDSTIDGWGTVTIWGAWTGIVTLAAYRGARLVQRRS